MLGMELEHNSTGIADAARDLHNLLKCHGARITDKRHDEQVRQSQSSATGTVILFARDDQNCAIAQEWDQATDNSSPFDPVVRTPEPRTQSKRSTGAGGTTPLSCLSDPLKLTPAQSSQ